VKKHLVLRVRQTGRATQSVWGREACGQEELKARPAGQGGRVLAQPHVLCKLTVRPGCEVGGQRLWGEASGRKRSACCGGDLGYCRHGGV